MADPSPALIVSANRGIGLGVVKEMFHNGWSVIATARRPNEAKELRDLAAANPGKLEIRGLDMTDAGGADSFAKGTQSVFQSGR
jgi:NAD(P)-dependent dehydrogenase (short-subunit alcohol dehydrogenase family)